ncbi:hypothetical protein A2336_03140 [Candidatus Peregrinibacteria bacterium RIFOXYB2_FULL_41_88]|nr:MAG: hypothetical protein A2336_03140 [Candidatus Peregrinibacteria bacterium RIFOXYB2_FULL_41_88]
MGKSKKGMNYLQIGLMIVIGLLIAFFSLAACMAVPSILFASNDMIKDWFGVGILLVFLLLFGSPLLFLISLFILVEKWRKDKLLIWLMIISIVLFSLGLIGGVWLSTFVVGPF